jgi:hypothetical protein
MSILAIALFTITTATSSVAAPAPADIKSFEATEQTLMNAIAAGDREPWDRVMDAACIITTEEGDVIPRDRFLRELRPLPPGLSGGITVRDLTVQPFAAFAIVRYLADEWEVVFGQRLTTKYRVTDTFRRNGSTWKMVASHVSVVTIDPPPQPFTNETSRGLVGTYQLNPDGWKFYVEMRDGALFGGRDPQKLARLIPLTPDAFVLQGALGEWLFVIGPDGKATHIVNFRKFEPLVWTRIAN